MKHRIIIDEQEYEKAFPAEQEFTDWINCVDHAYNENDNVPALTVTDWVSFKYNTNDN
jgi:hypothetical protein